MDLRSRVNAVIFDMDGLMFDTERIAQVAWQQAARDFGYDFPAETYPGVIGLALPDVRRFTQRVFGADFPFDSIYPQKQEHADKYITSCGTPIKEGLVELMARIEKASLPMALASSSGKDIILRNLDYAGLDAMSFDAVIGGDEISKGKPAPDIFLAASRRLQVAQERCLVLEDSNTGIAAAYAAGMLSIMIPDMLPPSPESRQRALRILPDLHAVRELFFKENGR